MDFSKYDQARRARMEEKAELLKALAHPIRLCILSKLAAEGQCTVGCFTSCLGASQSTISQHLAKLRAAQVVAVRKEGTSAYYFIQNPETEALIRFIIQEAKHEQN